MLIRSLESTGNLSRVDLRRSCPFPAWCSVFRSLFCDALLPLYSHSSSPPSASLLFLISADIFSPVMFRHKPHSSCCRLNLLSAGYRAQLINQPLLALRCAETTDGTDDFSSWFLLNHTAREEDADRVHQRRSAGASWTPRDSRCTNRPTSDK